MFMRITGAALAVALISAPAQAQEYRVDPSHAQVGFRVKHLGLANVRGGFNDIRGQLNYDAADPTRSQVSVQIGAASIDTNVERRDEDLKSANFLDVATHPQITFVSRSIERAGDQWIAHGDLTLHGVTKPVALPFVFTGPSKSPGNIERIGVEGELTIDRREFGITSDRMFENALVAGNEVHITLNVEFGRRLGPAPAGGR